MAEKVRCVVKCVKLETKKNKQAPKHLAERDMEQDTQNGDSNVNEREGGDVTMKLPLIDVNVVEKIDMVFMLKISKSLCTESATLVVCAARFGWV